MIIPAKFMSFFKTVLFFILFILNLHGSHSNSAGNGGQCRKREQMALLQFKAGLIDEHGLLSSWDKSTNCCEWKGVACDNRTNHVILLDLHGDDFPYPLEGNISASLLQLPHLQYLDLSFNHLQGEFPYPSTNSTSLLLTHLDLSWNNLNGQLHDSYLRLPNLEYLDLSRNMFSGRLPNLSSFPSLRVLRLHHNSFNGSLTESITRNLSRLEELVVGYNELEGVITEAHLSCLPQLQVLDLSFNLNITLRISSPSWMHHVQFRDLNLANCNLGPYFPKWLQNHNQLQELDISNSGIVDSIPSWFWDNIQDCMSLNLSHNQIYGVLPDLSSNFRRLWSIDLSWNEFTGSLPSLQVFYFGQIDFSNNKFSGMLLNFCNATYANPWIDLSNNLLSGEISRDCFLNLLSTVKHLNLANNNFSGDIPTTNNFSCPVVSLNLRNNSFRGEIPRTLMNCSALTFLDLGENEFIGKVPMWLGESMPELMVLILKSNMLYGSLPPSICRLANLRVMDISLNKITGTIPKCVINFTRMREVGFHFHPNFWRLKYDYQYVYYDSASVIWKGNEETYMKNLKLLKMIDLSSNELTGEIPQELTSLIGLLGLNLSRNNLVGFIPHDIDQLQVLNFLDLSRNRLSGDIPPTLSKLNHLGVLDLSFNNLSGRIPWDTHLQTFGDSTYLGNPGLCGPPLLWRPCPEDENPEKPFIDSEEEDDNFITRGFYISTVLGFMVAFWVVFWTLNFNKWWNVITIKIYITMTDWLYVNITKGAS